VATVHPLIQTARGALTDEDYGEAERILGLEVDVWLRCPSTEELWRFAESLPDPTDRERIPPPDGRRNMVMNWEHIQVEDSAEPWQDAFLFGIGQAQMLVDRARERGIEVEVYAVRVQPDGADFQPSAPATTEVSGDA
jgi:hypothetical protein